MLELIDVCIKIKDSFLIKDLSARVDGGQILTIMGPSGSGKSSLLSYIGGFCEPPLSGSGQLLLNQRPLNDVLPENRKVGLIFQEGLLFPHLSVINNLLLGIPAHIDKLAKKKLALQALAACDMAGYGDRFVQSLSGGQKARIALWRTLLSEPQLILLDEPFANLDIDLKQKTRDYFKEHIQERNVPVILVSHDHYDAQWADSQILNIADYQEKIVY